jgi:hypothetical protein
MLVKDVLSWWIIPSPAKQGTLLELTVPLQKSKSFAALLALLLPLDSAEPGRKLVLAQKQGKRFD